MRKIFIILLLLPIFANAQLSSIILRNDTIFSLNPTTGVYTQLTKTVPPKDGQTGNFVGTDGTDYVWGLPTASQLGLGNVTNQSKATMFTSPTFTGNAVLGSPASGNFSTGTFTWPTFNQSTTGSAATLTTPRTINGSSFNGSADITTDNDLLAYAALGSPILCQTVNQRLEYSNVSTALVDGQIKYEAIYLPKAATLTGLKFYVRVLGNYTGDNNNRVGLYSYSGGTLTLVASSANNASLWTSAANAIQTIPFSSTYAASAGIYFAAFLYNNSAQTTAPTLASGVALNNLAMSSTAMGFTNSAKLHGTSNGTDLPSSITMASITASVIPSWVGGY
jgi:hypothetical protein